MVATAGMRPKSARRQKRGTYPSRIVSRLKTVGRKARDWLRRWVAADRSAPRPFSKGTSGDILVQTLIARGISYRYLSPDEITDPRVAKLGRTVAAFLINGVPYYFEGGCLRVSDPCGVKVPGPLIDSPAALFVKKKDLVKSFLRKHGFSVPEGAAFPRNAQREAEAFFATLSASLRAAFAAVAERHERVLIEEAVSGAVYRFTCLAGRVIAVEFGRPANVEGDGSHTVAELVALKNAERLLNPVHARYLLRLGRRERAFLKQAGLDHDHIPEAGKLIFLNSVSNLRQGADIIDVTDGVHHSYIELVERAVTHLPDLVLCGADVVIQDVKLKATADNYHFLEVTCGPRFAAHHHPWRGQPRDVAGNLIDYLASLTLSYSIVRDEMSFNALQSEWEDLFQRAAVQTPFLRYSWLRLCWDRQRDIHGTSLFIVVVRKHDRPVLIAPFVLRPRGRSWQLSFLDSLTWQYNDVLVEDSVDASVYVDYFWETLAGMRSIRRFVSKWVREDSPLVSHLAAARQASKVASNRAPLIDLTKFGAWEVYFHSLSSHLRRDHGRRLRNLEKRGAVEFRMADGSTYSSDMAWLFAQKRHWLERKGKSSTWFKAPGTEELFTAAAREGLSSGRTWLTVLSVDGETIAAKLGFREGSTLYMSKTAYDPAWDTYSPGRTLTLLTIERAFQEGLQKCDLMMGRGALKDRLATGAIKARSQKIWLHRP